MPARLETLQTISKIVKDLSGIVIDPAKDYLFETKLRTLLKEEKLSSLDDLALRLGSRQNLFLNARVVEALTINETFFFRDGLPFDALRDTILPALLNPPGGRRPLAFWSAACSSGQEPYSLAMCVMERCPDFVPGEARIFASDIADEMVNRTREGRYTDMEIKRGLPPEFKTKYFEAAGADWRVRESLRRMLDVRKINLAAEWPDFPPLDVVFLRNVLIYFDLESRKRILAKVRRLLRPEGYLFLGGAETTLQVDAAFEPVDFGRAGCYRIARTDPPRHPHAPVPGNRR